MNQIFLSMNTNQLFRKISLKHHKYSHFKEPIFQNEINHLIFWPIKPAADQHRFNVCQQLRQDTLRNKDDAVYF